MCFFLKIISIQHHQKLLFFSIVFEFYMGTILFYHFKNFCTSQMENCVNSLIRVTSISTVSVFEVEPSLDLCQFLYSGNFHFYEVAEAEAQLTQEVCQFPYSGNFHFYRTKYRRNRSGNGRCQFPYSGNFHFYDKGISNVRVDYEVCQFPYSGNFHFYRRWETKMSIPDSLSIPLFG